VRGCYRKSRDRKVTGTMSGSMFYACATGSCAISVLVGIFTGSDVSHVTDRKRPALTGSMFCACPVFSTHLFISSSTSTMDTECDLRSRDANVARGIFR
jgi:hypothetical protein